MAKWLHSGGMGGTYKDSNSQVSQSKRYKYSRKVKIPISEVSLFIGVLTNNGFPRFLGNGPSLAYVTESGLVRYGI